MRRIEMGKVKEILRMSANGFSCRDIAASVGCSKSSVSETICRAKHIELGDFEHLSEQALEDLLFGAVSANQARLKDLDMTYILRELARPHVTRQLLWEEYRLTNPNGLMYSQFCERIRRARKADEISFPKVHKGGQECEVDWAGSTISYYDAKERRHKEAFLFVAVLPASAYPFARAYDNQKMPSWIDAHIKALRSFGGVPKILIPDNTKTAVSKADLFDPVMSKTYEDMARHYGAVIVPARAGKPKDKGAVENAVKQVSQRILAALRDEKFSSLSQVNASIAQKLEELRERPFKAREGCRRSAFEEIDKPSLSPLPANHYELAEFAQVKIGINYHVCYQGFYYSVPYQYRGVECSVRATSHTVEVFVGEERLSAHPRRFNKKERYATVFEHLPKEHQVVSEWNDKRFLSWAKKFGPHTHAYISALLKSTTYSVQAYRACMGVLRQVSEEDVAVVEKAAQMSLADKQFSSKYFGFALKRAKREVQNKHLEHIPIRHANIRGKESYTRSGTYA